MGKVRQDAQRPYRDRDRCSYFARSLLLFSPSTKCMPLKAICKMAAFLFIYMRHTGCVTCRKSPLPFLYTVARNCTSYCHLGCLEDFTTSKPSGNLKINLLLSLTTEKKDENTFIQLVTEAVVSQSVHISQQRQQCLLPCFSMQDNKMIYNLIIPVCFKYGQSTTKPHQTEYLFPW